MEPDIQAPTYILVIQSQTLLFSTILQATWIHILGPYPPGAGTLKYTLNTDCPSQSDLQTSVGDLMDDQAMADRPPSEVGSSQEMTENLDGLRRCVSDDVSKGPGMKERESWKLLARLVDILDDVL